eukprot:5223477-Prymnesium_polylepis.1
MGRARGLQPERTRQVGRRQGRGLAKTPGAGTRTVHLEYSIWIVATLSGYSCATPLHDPPPHESPRRERAGPRVRQLLAAKRDIDSLTVRALHH